MWAIPTGTSSVLKKKQVKSPSPESRVPETGSDPPIGSGQDSGRDKYVLYVTFVASKIVYDTRNAMPRKTCKFRLSRNSTKFYVLARFREKIPTVKSVLSSEI